MTKRFVLLTFLCVLVLSACSNIDEFTGKTYNVSVPDGHPTEPVKYRPIVTLEFLEGNKFKNTRGYEEGTYELKEDKLLLYIEDDNENLEIEFTLEDSNNEFSDYASFISNYDYQMEDNGQVSKYRGFLEQLNRSSFEFVPK